MKVKVENANAVEKLSRNNGAFRKLSLFNSKKKDESYCRDLYVEDLTRKLLPVIGSPKFAIVIHNVFTSEECNELIELAESVGFEDALIQGPDGEVLDTSVRKCKRCILDKPDLAADWYVRALDALDKSGTSSMKNKFLHAPWVTMRADDDITRHAVGLNERLRFLRYNKGDRFGPHQDIPFTRGPEQEDRAGDTSHLTFIVFLNDKMKGGCLRFIGDDDRHMDINPRVGSIAIFDHDINHEGCKISSGQKYAVRSDVMYSTRP